LSLPKCCDIGLASSRVSSVTPPSITIIGWVLLQHMHVLGAFVWILDCSSIC
jgi:hypothetical protein